MDNDPQLNESLKGEIGAIYRLKQEHDLWSDSEDGYIPFPSDNLVL